MAVEKPKTPGTPPPPPAPPRATPAEVAQLVAEIPSGGTPEPQWVRFTIPEYPNVTHLLFHDDGRVTWK